MPPCAEAGAGSALPTPQSPLAAAPLSSAPERGGQSTDKPCKHRNLFESLWARSRFLLASSTRTARPAASAQCMRPILQSFFPRPAAILRVCRNIDFVNIQASPERGGQTVEKPLRAREGRSPLELSIVPSGVYGGRGLIFAPENPISQSKNRFLAGSAPEKSLIFSGDWRGWQEG